MVQIVMPNGGITTLEEHEVLSFADLAGKVLPAQPVLQDPGDVDPYLLIVKMDEVPGAQ